MPPTGPHPPTGNPGSATDKIINFAGLFHPKRAGVGSSDPPGFRTGRNEYKKSYYNQNKKLSFSMDSKSNVTEASEQGSFSSVVEMSTRRPMIKTEQKVKTSCP